MTHSKTLAHPKAVLSESSKRATQVILPVVYVLTEEELLEKLGEYGLPLDRDSLKEWTATAGSVDEVLSRLMVQDRNQRARPEAQLVWVWAAIRVLWERWFPETPSFEMLDELVSEGYEQKDTPEGCEAWLKAWPMLQQLADRLQLHTLRQFDERFEGTELLCNWVQDVEMAMGDLARPKEDREWYQRRIQYCESFLSRFPNEAQLMVQNMQRALAESISGIGENQRADELFQKWLDEDPRWSWGWIGWADCYMFAASDRRDLNRAEKILGQGLEIEGMEDRDAFYERLEDIFEQQGRPDKVAEVRAALARLKADTAPNPVKRTQPKVGRNDPCPCASGKKFKKCCGR